MMTGEIIICNHIHNCNIQEAKHSLRHAKEQREVNKYYLTLSETVCYTLYNGSCITSDYSAVE